MRFASFYNPAPTSGQRTLAARLRRVGVTFLLSLLIPLATSAESLETAPEDPFEFAWDRLSKLLILQSIENFEQAIAEDPERSREGQLGLGIAHLNLQPKSRTTIQTAQDHLLEVKQGDANDEFGIRARYFLGRIQQLHSYDPDWEAAADIYHRLHEEHPDHPMGELARVRWITIHLYEPTDAETKASRFTDAETFRGTFVNDRARRDFHLVMANAYTHFGQDDQESRQMVLEHLLGAVEAGIHNRQTLATSFVRIAEIARLLENYTLADEFYGRFLDSFTRDNRVDWVADRRLEIQSYLEDSDDTGTDS